VARPNPWGLFDMHGNLWEWCQDVYDPRAYAKRPHGWSACVCEDFNPTKREEVSRVMRGGSWNNVASSCRSASRGRRQHSVKGWSRGFRVLLSPPENSQGASQPI
jgi:formylglycine-generating enzyme required for sulfatase activity